MKMSQQMQEHRQMRIETGTAFWSAVARAALRDEPSRGDETRCASKKLVAGHWYGCGNCTLSFSPSYMPVDFLWSRMPCLLFHPRVIVVQLFETQFVWCTFPSHEIFLNGLNKKFRDGLENCLALAKNYRLGLEPTKIKSPNWITWKGKSFESETSTFILSQGFQPLLFQIFSQGWI